ncbi:MAG TPA: FHA domain-containing protein [Candidatus Acidoferrales bacterium]|nr:FHA domain-containing protein [Candidatus Acidoferrales bacterium]
MPRFLIHHPGEDSRVFELLGDRPISIGRAKSSTLVLDNASISRLHAVVRSTPDGRWQIIDRASSNGVKVNGAAVKETVLRANDEIVLGEYRMRFFEDSAARDMVTYGTPELPPAFAKVLSEPAYSGTFLPVQAIGSVTSTNLKRPPTAEERLRTLEQENRLLTLLYRVTRTLAELSTVGDITKRILDLVLEIQGAERGFAMLLDRESIGRGDFSRGGYGFEPALIRYRPGAKSPQSQGSPQLTISQSIIRQVMQGGLPLLVSDPQADPRLAASESIAAAGIQSAMCSPLGVKGKHFGLLYVDNLSRRGMFTVDDLNLFTVIASQAGLAIDRVRPVEEPSEQPQPSATRE